MALKKGSNKVLETTSRPNPQADNSRAMFQGSPLSTVASSCQRKLQTSEPGKLGQLLLFAQEGPTKFREATWVCHSLRVPPGPPPFVAFFDSESKVLVCVVADPPKTNSQSPSPCLLVSDVKRPWEKKASFFGWLTLTGSPSPRNVEKVGTTGQLGYTLPQQLRLLGLLRGMLLGSFALGIAALFHRKASKVHKTNQELGVEKPLKY